MKQYVVNIINYVIFEIKCMKRFLISYFDLKIKKEGDFGKQFSLNNRKELCLSYKDTLNEMERSLKLLQVFEFYKNDCVKMNLERKIIL